MRQESASSPSAKACRVQHQQAPDTGSGSPSPSPLWTVVKRAVGTRGGQNSLEEDVSRFITHLCYTILGKL